MENGPFFGYLAPNLWLATFKEIEKAKCHASLGPTAVAKNANVRCQDVMHLGTFKNASCARNPARSTKMISACALARPLLGGGGQILENGPNTVSGSTVSNTELSEFFGPHRVRGANSASSFQPSIYVPKRIH